MTITATTTTSATTNTAHQCLKNCFRSIHSHSEFVDSHVGENAEAPLFVVVGATGSQGGSVVQALKASSAAYRVRAVTRDVAKPSAKALVELGCEVVAANTDNKAEIEKAFEGAEYVFGMTVSGPQEVANGKIQVDAAKAAGVKTFIWSSQLHLGNISNGKMSVPLFDSKAEVAAYAHSIGLSILEVCPGTFSAGIIERFVPRKTPDGSFVLAMPMSPNTKLTPIDIETDYGRYAIDALEKGKTGKVFAAPGYVTVAEVAKIYEEVSGQTVTYSELPGEVYKTLAGKFVGEQMAAAILNMYTAFSVVGYYAGADLTESNTILSTPAGSLSEYLHANKAEVIKKMGL